jgi:hypothetical protein
MTNPVDPDIVRLAPVARVFLSLFPLSALCLRCNQSANSVFLIKNPFETLFRYDLLDLRISYVCVCVCLCLYENIMYSVAYSRNKDNGFL